MKSFLTLKNFLNKHKWSYIIGVFWLLIVDYAQLMVPDIVRNLTNDIQNNILNKSSVTKYALLFILAGLFIAVGRYFWRINILGASREVEYYLRKKIFNHLLTLPPNYFNTHKTGDLMAHATNDINAVRMALGFGTIMIVDSSFMIILTIIRMVRTTSLRLTAMAVFTMPIIMILVTRFGRIIHKRFRKVQEAFSDLTDVSQESFSGIRVIKAFNQEELVSENFSNVNEENLKKNLSLVKIHGLFHPLLHFIASISILIIILFGGREVINNNILLGDFVAFNMYLGLLMWPARALGMVVNVLQRGSASMARINQILEEESDIKEIENPITPENIQGNIEFINVSYKYPNSKHYAIKDINFSIKKGKMLAIVGRTGSGKSTIANLLLRLYDINEGEIKLDGINIKDLSLSSLRESIGFVPQDNFLFSQTIEKNIAFAFDEQIPMDKIIGASKSSEVYDNIMGFTNKFDTVLGERGVTLSGGQKQRVSIARALIKDSPIIIMDDSLSAVDTETEEKILNNLKEAINGVTSIIISHRVSTIKEADEIIYLVDGEIIERGTHEELLKLNGEYKDLYEKQLLEEKVSQA